jgi:hypothetical protein
MELAQVSAKILLVFKCILDEDNLSSKELKYI